MRQDRIQRERLIASLKRVPVSGRKRVRFVAVREVSNQFRRNMKYNLKFRRRLAVSGLMVIACSVCIGVAWVGGVGGGKGVGDVGDVGESIQWEGEEITTAKTERFNVSLEELQSNLYKVAKYKELDDGTYDAYYIVVDNVEGMNFEEFVDYINGLDSYEEDYVDCQYVVSSVVEWCKLNDVSYNVIYQKYHVKIEFWIDGVRYMANWGNEPTLYEESK